MSKKFLSFLGDGYYGKCVYKYEKLPHNKIRQCETYFIQEAIAKIFCDTWTKKDTAIIFLTERAKKENYLENPKKKKPNTTEFEHRMGLEKDLMSSNCKFNLKSVDIKDGNSMDEIWENFDIIINEIEDGDEIIFDITHAFRYIPILALVVLNYAKSLKNIKIKGIYYGNYAYNNGKYKNPEFADGQKPIMDLKELDEILEWSQAVDSFTKYGNSDHIKKVAEEILDNKKNKKYYKSSEPAIRCLVQSLNDFTKTIQTCRGRTIKSSDETNSISKAYENLKENLKVFMDLESTMKPLEHIIGKIEDSIDIFKPVQNRKEIINTGLGIVEWSLNNNLIQQAYTALLETMITYMCILEHENYNDRKIRESVKRKYNNIYFENKRFDIKSKQYIAKIGVTLGSIRNDINHYGYSMDGYDATKKPSKSYEELETIISDSYYDFRDYIIEQEAKLVKSYV